MSDPRAAFRDALVRLLESLPLGQDPAYRSALGRALADLAAWRDDGAALAALLESVAADLRVADGAAPPAALWPLAARWAEGPAAARALAERVRWEALNWHRRGCPDADLWRDELLRPARELLARNALLETLEQDLVLADFLTPEAEHLLAETVCQTTEDGRREDIGLRLSAIGDPRPGVLPVNGCPQPWWRPIPGGTVLIDGRRQVRLAPFRLAAFPVTQAQFQLFLTAADGFDNPAWWQGLRRRPLAANPLSRRGNYPVTGVSWHDATAFCRWLAARLNRPVRLPEEAEWQWAAQSAREDFVYPWGADWQGGHANTDEAGIGRTIAVGMYPAGNSLQGVADLAGNTWEWCLGSFAAQGSARGARVIRGGSWRVNRGFARADFRLDASPEDRVGSTGFRLAMDEPDGPD